MVLRYEYKYYVPARQETELRKMLSPFVSIDKYALNMDNNEYTVRSIYFDTADLFHYREKVEGFSYRKKIRLRGYNTPNGYNPVFLEIKNKHEIPLFKTRAKTTFENTVSRFETGNLYDIILSMSKNHAQANSFLYQILANNLRPVVNVIYERIPFTEKVDTENQLRITFDKNLRSTAMPKLNELYEEKGVKPALPGYFILEVKFNKFYPIWMKSIIARFQLKHESASKYVICMDSQEIPMKYNRYRIWEQKFI
ncbi:MAG: polyphosphate polymerase domain-containing protein [Bacteroidales bacterium]